MWYHKPMISKPEPTLSNLNTEALSVAELRALVGRFEQLLTEKDAQIQVLDQTIGQLDESLRQTIKRKDADIHERDRYILKLEEIVRLRMVQKFAASSEKLSHQIHLFDEAELEAELAELLDSLPEAQLPPEEAKARKQRQSRTRDFSDTLVRERVELRLTEAEKAGSTRTWFSKVKEELEYIPAQLKVLEIWQEKAVFETATGDEVISASRPVHPLGKSFASPSLLAQVITSKYADGLPLYRQEQIFKRLGHEISRTCMANWVIQLAVQLKPLLQRLRESQCSGDYLQADETRMQVLKEKGKTAQSQKWMWVTRGGPPSQLSVLFEYDPSRAQGVADRLLQGFSGVLQADAYAGYASISKQQGVTRIGCWDHARRKFVEVVRANAKVDARQARKLGRSKAEEALGYIRKLYRIETHIKDLTAEERYRVRQELALPELTSFRTWLETETGKVMKGSKTRQAMDYILNQWPELIGYCQRGDLHISNALAENAIRPFAVGRKAWLFADTRRGAEASATWYSIIETAKANNLEPLSYIRHVLDHIATADTPAKIDALLPWNVAAN